jgi:integrase
MAKKKKKRKTTKQFESWGGRELIAVINGKVCGVKHDKGARSFFWREPQPTGRSIKRNLARDKGKAAKKWWDIIEAHQRAQLTTLPHGSIKNIKKTPIISQVPYEEDEEYEARKNYLLNEYLPQGKNETDEEYDKRILSNPNIPWRIEHQIPEKVLATIFNQWLEDPYECSKKLGREDIAKLSKLSPKDPIRLSTMGQFYFDYIPTERPQASETERRKVKTWFEQFVRIINKTYLDDVSQGDIADYTQRIMRIAKKQGWSNTWISHRWGAVRTVIRTYGKALEDKIEMDRVLRIWQDFRSPSKGDFKPTLITKKQLKELLSKVNTKWKAVVLWSLNTCSGSVDARHLRVADINLKDKTISYRRKKTKVPKCGVLWNETLEAISKYQKERKGQSVYMFLSNNKTQYSEGGFGDYIRTYIRPKLSWHFEFRQIRDSARYAAEKSGISPNHIYIAMGHRIKGGQDDAYLLRHPELVQDVSDAISDYYFSRR